jgi:hypothetical protein
MKARTGLLVPHDGTRERAWRASRRWYVLWLVGRSLLVLSPLIVILGGFFLLQHGRADDRSGGRAGQGTGEVTSVVFASATRGAPPYWLVSVRLPGLPPPAPVTAHQSFIVGQRVRVGYVVGRSGRVYVERIEPLPSDGPKR